ncbi:MAG: Holliday junction branch migration protein RuvA [Alistipes sp.]|nr:Holliday junction branch migration protein RuvA [Alistipes sp.]
MYEYIIGHVDTVTPTWAVIEAGGIGYLVNISVQTCSQIGSQQQVKLYLHFVVREDAQVFYGFYTREERDIFRLLIGVSGVGGNTARMILSTFTADEVCGIVANGQAELLKTVKGLGLKTAQKIIVDLRDKIGGVSGNVPTLGLALEKDDRSAEAVSALVMLGFGRPATEKVVRELRKQTPEMSVEELVRSALKRL